MRDILDLDRYPLMFNLEGFVREEATARAVAEIRPVMDTFSFTHRRAHNVYFRKEVPGLRPDHPALRQVETISRTVCADQIPDSVPVWIYEWPQFVVFLSACLEKDSLFAMRDPLARVNVMSYREGEALNWHFDRSQFTTTILLQAPERGGEFQYRSDLRTESDPNYEGVARLLHGEDNEVKSLSPRPGTLSVFMGKNTIHRVTPVEGRRERLVAVFSYYERPGVMFSREEQIGFYGRAA